MSEPFLGEVKIVGFNFAPRGWAFCDGQILPINQNQSLYSLLGTTYGGDGRTTFALPDLRGRVPVHPNDNGINQGSRGGEENHTLTVAEIPSHGHTLKGVSTAGNQFNPTGHFFASTGADPHYSNSKNASAAPTQAIGGSQSHNNMQPFLTLNFCIALQGLFPSRN